jgi:triacylglycerol lipase
LIRNDPRSGHFGGQIVGQNRENNKSSGSGSHGRPSGTRSLVAPELLAALDLLPGFDFTEEIVSALRAGAPAARQMSAPPLSAAQQAVSREERFVPGPSQAPDVRVLVYTPHAKNGAAMPAFLHMHGGGYVIGNPEINNGSNRSLASETGCVIVSVDYRLAPDTRFPGSVEDCYAALSWLHKQAESLGVDTTRIAVGGESAGAGHAASLALLVRERREFKLCLQMLDSPMLDDRTGSTSDPHPYCGEFVWTATSNRYGWRSLLGTEPGGVDVPVGAVPARTQDLTGLPPTYIAVGALDLFLEESLEYARRLIRAGVPTELHVVPGAYHGFGVGGAEAPQVQSHLRLRQEALARALKRVESR